MPTPVRGEVRRTSVPIPDRRLPPYPIGPAARHYGVNPATMRRWCRMGLIPHRITPSGQYEVDIWAHLQMADRPSADWPAAGP